MKILAGLFFVACLILGQNRFVSSALSVSLFLALYAFQTGCLVWVWRARVVPSRRFVLVTALLFRLALLPAGLRDDSAFADMGDPLAWQRFLLFDQDVWRFLWDAKVAGSGQNPYEFAPASSSLDELGEDEPWRTVRSSVSYPLSPTIYPPGAQLLFQISHQLLPGNPLGIKLLAIAADLGISAMLPLPCALLYAWNPLVLKAGAASAHYDAVVALLLLALFYNRHRPWLAGALLGLAALVKLSPLLLLPWLVRHTGWKSAMFATGITVLGLMPFYSYYFVALQNFQLNWQFNAGYFYVLDWASPGAARILSALSIAAAALLLALSTRLSAAQQAAWTMFLCVVLSPTVMPWYLVWCLPVALIAGEAIPVAFTFAVAISTLVMIDGVEHSWWLWVEHMPLAGIIIYKVWITFRRESGTG